MKKQIKFLWIGIFIICLLFVLEINKGIFNYLSIFSNFIKENIFSIQTSITYTIDKYFEQSAEIERLKAIEYENEQNKILISSMDSDINALVSLLELNKKPTMPNVFLIEAYSYVNMGQYTQVWLKKNDDFENDDEAVFGLIRNGYAAGIAITKNNKLLGILNGDLKASYGVYIGESKSIGILKNNLNDNVVIEYINAWSEIKEGDEVITNGLDNIFFEGIKVGKIKQVRQEYGYIVAEVDLYNKNNNIGYFWLVNVKNKENKKIEKSKENIKKP